MSEHEPREVPINLVEFIDHDAPLVEELKRAQRIVALANRALEATGIRLVPTADADESAEVLTSDIPETIGMDEASEMMTAVRLDELTQLETFIEDHYALPDPFDPVIIRGYIEMRRAEIDEMTNRPPDA